MSDNKHILVILPHPDDESFATAGTIMHYKDQGYKVTYICLTAGEMGRNLGNPPIATRESLPEVRKKELEEAGKILGIDEIIFYGLRDKTIEFHDELELASRMKETIEQINPEKVFTFYPGFSIHPDHDACGAVVCRAVSMIEEEKRPKLYAMAIANGSIQMLGKPNITYDVKQYSERKMNALKAHQTQMQEVATVIEQNLKKGNKNTDEWFHYESYWIVE